MIDIYSLRSAVVPMQARVLGFRGSEAISRPYRFDIVFTLPNSEASAFDMAGGIGAPATLALTREDDDGPILHHGVLASLELVYADDMHAVYRAALVPRLWRLGVSFHSQVFTNQSVPDIVRSVLESSGLSDQDYRLQLKGSYTAEEHVCQYKESHLDFIARWMENEGIYYFFEQAEDREILVIADDVSVHELGPRKPVPYFPVAGHDRFAGQALEAFACRHATLPTSVRLADFDYTKPTLDVSARAGVANHGAGDVSVYGARFFTPDGAQRYAAIRVGELLARRMLFHGDGTAYRLRSGYLLELENHPLAPYNQRYLAVEVEHFGNQGAGSSEVRRFLGFEFPDVYRVELTAIPATTQFRPERRAQWPRIHGLEHALIDGEMDSEYAQLDEHGRYAVKFMFDESPLKDGKASTRVRMAQPHGGGIEGCHFPLRKGTEVVLAFLGGDPDRPVITGVVPNSLTPSPVTSGNNTTNVIQTGGRNRFELEDKDGQQRITLSSPSSNSYIRMGAPNADHNMIIHTKGATNLDAGGDLDISAGGKETHTVTGTVTETFTSDQTTTVSGTRKLTAATIENTTPGRYTVNAQDHYDISTIHHFIKSGGTYMTADDIVKVSAKYFVVEAPNIQLIAGGSSIIMKGDSITIVSPQIDLNP